MVTIRLDKKSKTIKVVNRRKTIKLTNPSSSVSLKHTGKTNPLTFTRVHHGSDPNVARPNVLYVEWVGSVAPNNATVEDTWVQTL